MTLPCLPATGEVDLSGRVLKVSGVRQKAIAVHATGMKGLILPKVRERAGRAGLVAGGGTRQVPSPD